MLIANPEQRNERVIAAAAMVAAHRWIGQVPGPVRGSCNPHGRRMCGPGRVYRVAKGDEIITRSRHGTCMVRARLSIHSGVLHRGAAWDADPTKGEMQG
jgi:hypothetical protein